jgi:penicillin-insensitive murein endopeptidase
MLEVQPKDSRGYFMLPQAPEDAGYYVYGTPLQGAGQYAHPSLMSVPFFIEREWQATDNRKFGIGNISLAGGGRFRPHATDKDGLQVDIRPLRKDGAHVPVSYFQAGYDKDATMRLIEISLGHPAVIKVYFNDSTISGVWPLADHDNHFHVEMRASTR